ncbi:MAG TPA: DMT family transporter [Terriglobales bacterium]|jgi:drug/metabolite transporter (DMT)-like permease|nr:DMT family transporter [Terriglobales bacterium]
MALAGQVASSLYALGAVCTWGVSDFLGGYTARRFHAFFLAALGHMSGTLLMFSIALAAHAPFPPQSHLIWAAAAGVAGGLSLALFYRALSLGNMGISAPVTAVLSAGIPTIFGIVREGFPGYLPSAGFALALAGIWLVSRPEQRGRPKGLGLAVVAGIGFALFFIFIKKTGSGDAFWIAGVARTASFAVTGAITLFGRRFSPFYRGGVWIGLLAGCIDVSGTAFFVRAGQTGRLDVAVVLSSLYPAITVLLARIFLHEKFTRWKTVGMLAALAAVPMIARA